MVATSKPRISARARWTIGLMVGGTAALGDWIVDRFNVHGYHRALADLLSFTVCCVVTYLVCHKLLRIPLTAEPNIEMKNKIDPNLIFFVVCVSILILSVLVWEVVRVPPQ